jgi:hypothetical protein
LSSLTDNSLSEGTAAVGRLFKNVGAMEAAKVLKKSKGSSQQVGFINRAASAPKGGFGVNLESMFKVFPFLALAISFLFIPFSFTGNAISEFVGGGANYVFFLFIVLLLAFIYFLFIKKRK